jgi:hypothetical protein
MNRIGSHAQRFKELVGSDAEPETMEDKITLALGLVIPTMLIVRSGPDDVDEERGIRPKPRPHQRLLVDIIRNSRHRSISPNRIYSQKRTS